MKYSPTAEQQAIINAVANGKSLKVAALAGTGKTSTLELIAAAYPDRRGLYLAYNKALQLEAEKKFPSWIDCKTVHGLAYKKEGFKFAGQLQMRPDYDKIIDSLDIEDFKATRSIGRKKISIELNAYKQIALCREILRYFTFSNQMTIERQNFEWFFKKELNELFPDFYQNKNMTNCFESMIEKILTETQKIWDQQRSSQSEVVPANHDTYLKIYQLSRPRIAGYDYIMLDEAQDANPCILDILANQNCQVIYVGDEHQQIYEFRGTVNAMQTLELPVLYLTQSFRFGDAIADEANAVLEMLGSQSLVKGLPSINSKLAEIKNVPYTLLARTNAKLFEKCIIAIQEGYNCSLVADVHKIVLLISSVYYIWIKKPEWVKDERMMRFKDWSDLLEYVDAEDDAEMLGAINFVLTNKTRTLDLLKLIRESGKFLEERADIVFSTAHKSKGREWDNVIIADDFRLDNNQDKNLYYVALTRAKKVLDHGWPTSKNDKSTL